MEEDTIIQLLYKTIKKYSDMLNFYKNEGSFIFSIYYWKFLVLKIATDTFKIGISKYKPEVENWVSISWVSLCLPCVAFKKQTGLPYTL